MKFLSRVPVLDFIKKRKKIVLAVIIFLLILIYIFRPKAAKVIDTQKIVSGDIVQSISASGTVNANTSVNLNFLSGGKLVYLGAKKGDFVKKGQTIAQLDLRSTQKNVELALRDYANQRNTFDQTLDNNHAKSINDAQNDTIKRILQTNQNNLEKAVLSLELQDLAKEQSVLLTPIAGIVTRADVNSVGVNVTGATTFTVSDPNDLVFSIDIDEADIGKVTDLQMVKLSLDAYPNNTLTLPIAKIDFASHATTTGGTAYTVEASLPDNIDYRYKIGMTGDAEIIIAQRKHVLVVPLSSVTDSGEIYLKQNKKFIKQNVKLGLKSDIDAEVLSGVREGDVVALQPSDVESVK